jgi:LacI family transcriptional regulator
MKVTLHDVAQRAQVSIATASRALNGLSVSEPVLERVRGAAAELGYVANEAARVLRSERTLTMGLIFYDLRNTLGIELIDALSEGVEAAGYSLLIASARKDVDRYDRLLRRFLERRVDAVFCISPKGEGEALARYEAAEVPVIALFEAAGAFGRLPLITPSFSESSAALARHLSALGHRHAALLFDRARSRPLVAIIEALKAAHLKVDIIEPNEAGGMSEVVAGLRRQDEPPTVVIAFEAKARGLMVACDRAMIEVPRDLSIVSVTEPAAERTRKRHVTSIVVDPQRMGRAAAASMLAWLAGSRPTGRTLVQAGVFEAKETTGPAQPSWAADR